MKSIAWCWPALGALAALAGCVAAPVDDSEPLNRACSRTNCFVARNVRDIEVIDDRTMVVYVGAQRCPFQVEVDGMFCNLGVTPALTFRSAEARICAYDRTVVDLGIFARSEEHCRVRDVRSLTDNELLELLVDHEAVAPPTPVEPAEIRVGDSNGRPASREADDKEEAEGACLPE